MMRERFLQSLQKQRGLILILAGFVALSVTYSIVTPIFEAGDEIWHYPFVQHLATGHGLPIQDPNVETLWEQEGGQPPLYYALSALATFWIDTRDLPERLWRNPHARIGIPLDFGNKNLIVHTSAENFPWRNTTLAVHLIRFLSIFFSAITVALTYLLALEISGARNLVSDRTLAAIAAGIVAFNPMFLFISASVNNDNLATMLAALSLLLLARLVTRGATMKQFAILGVVLGFGALTKASLLGLLLVATVVFAYLLWKAIRGERGSGRGGDTHPLGVLKGSVFCLAIVIAIAGWWYVRNWILYSDPLAFNVWVQIAGGRATPLTFAGLLDEFQGFRISFWGNFGGVNIIAPEWVYSALDAFTALAAIGLLIGAARRALPRMLALPALWLALISILLVRWTWLTMASQGRLIFPAISTVAILFAYGLAQFQISDFRFQILRLRHLSFAHLSFVIFLLAFAALAPFTIIAPAYALPARLPADASAPNHTRITFGDQAELVGYALPQKSVAPGNPLPVTLYWRAHTRIEEDFSVYIRLFDAAGNVVGRWNAFPGGGMYPTRFWQTDEIVVDSYRIPVSSDARGPSVGRVEVGLFRRVPLENLSARDPQGAVITPTIARFKITGAASAQIENPVAYNFGDKISLVGYALPARAASGSDLSLKLFWRAQSVVEEDYMVFVHLVDARGKIIAQKDDQPQRGAYPMSFWDVGETIADEYALNIPRDALPGEYKIVVGVYRASDGTRLPVQGSDHLILATLRISN
jgi:hypothetical protein